MSGQTLLIKQLSNSGELLKVVTCHAGQISVFRSSSQAALMPYQRALAGIPGPERFSVSLDEFPYSAEQAYLIGFGEQFSGVEAAQTTKELLTAAGVSSDTAHAVLVTYGLDRYEDVIASRLPPCEERRLRILCALYGPHTVVVMNDPFDPVAAQWRERFAEILVNHVKNHPRVIVVTSLSHRPECWIDNEQVARIQVGESVQKTIGFGTDNKELSQLVQQVRKSGGHGPEDPIEAPTAKQSHTSLGHSIAHEIVKKPKGRRNEQNLGGGQHPQRAGFLLATILSLILGFGLYAGSGILNRWQDANDSLGTTTPTSESAVSSSRDVETSESIAQSSLASVASSISLDDNSGAGTVASVDSLPAQQPTQSPNLVLNLYPAQIRKSIIDGFEGGLPATTLDAKAPRLSIEERQRTSQGIVPPSGNPSAQDLLSVLQNSSSPEERPSEQPLTQEDLNNLSPEQRREAIRQRFLEAIQRANQGNWLAMKTP